MAKNNTFESTYNKKFYGMVIDRDGNIKTFPSDYCKHEYSFDLMISILGLKYTPLEKRACNVIGERALPLYKIVNSGYICLVDSGYKDYEYLEVYLPEDLSSITSNQKDAILEKDNFINTYKHHTNYYVPTFEELMRREIAFERLSKANENYNEILEVIETKVKK